MDSDCDCDDATYKIVRFYAPHLRRENEVIETGLTLEEAQEHCQRDDTREEGKWFDGYTEESRGERQLRNYRELHGKY